MENSEKRVRQSGNIAQNLTLVTLTVYHEKIEQEHYTVQAFSPANSE
jgi:hypothetical protein